MTRATRRAWLGWTAALVMWPQAAHAVRREQRVLFGSAVELLLPDTAPTAASEAVWHGLATMNARWNAWKPGELDDLNTALRAGRPHRPAPALAETIRHATALEAASAGHFNPAIGGVVGAWGFHDDVMQPGTRPAAEAIERWTAVRPSLARLEWRGSTVRSSHRGVQIDLGAYAKGVALDWALERLQRLGVRDALLNLGGNLAAMGRIDGRAWQVGVRDPHRDALAARVAVQGREAVVTSGTYERWRLLDGQRFTHIIDPVTGQPAAGLDSVTVVHASAALADAAATALLVAGPQRWREVAQRMGVDQVLVIDRTGVRDATARMASRLASGRRAA
ncbi:MAG: FAD:protein FMN transferase [Aquincola sp.]|nr:FAD:protein FMN transferase [Aquincola sp.]